MWAKMEFWDGMEHAFMMPSITAEERTAVWDAVAGYVQQQLLLRKGVRIPTLGSFDAVPKRIQAGDEAVIIRRPVFRLARNLVVVHNLTDDKAYLPGNKELEPLKYSKVAAAASVSRRKAEGCIQGTTSLLSHCLGKGENVALVLRDVGVLLIEGRKVQMKFYYDFLETLCGKENLEKAVFKVPQLLDVVVSRMTPVASLSFSGRVIIFPKFEMECVPKPLPRVFLRALRQVPGEEKQLRRQALPPLGQGRKNKAPSGSFPLPNSAIPQFWEITGTKERKRKKSRVRRQPVIPRDQPVSGQRQGKPTAKDRASKQSRAQAAEPESCGGEGEGVVEKILAEIAMMKATKAKPSRPREASTFVTPVIAVLSATSSEASLPEEPTYEVLRRPPPRPRRQK
ncbi:coiled-coil domain-containing protein 81-like [Gymnogyps californianus]|uniref:coiled-coil domain-containing protein 81-like n=1 Tax=Gymnogyps californianus TaxID=33616 RepID=UPI0021C7CEE8|nr:coiled-coil domain-containing protein 81-like [Gymnogyps californianus]